MKELDKVLHQNEKVFWEGMPSFWPFFFGISSMISIFGLFWIILIIPGFASFGIGFLLLPHFWIGLGLIFGVPIYQILVYRHTYCAITDKRVILQKGWIGRDFEIIDFDQITNAEVNIGVFDKLFGKGNTGSILIFTAGSFAHTSQGTLKKPNIFYNISSPYDVFKFFEKIQYDIKTDIQYPNKLRPGENPGYKTDYNPNKKQP